MRKEFALLAVISLFAFMVNSVYADVTSLSLKEDSYSRDDKFSFVGLESEGGKSIFVIIRGSSGNYIGMVSDPVSDSDGSFETIERPVEDFFSQSGTYNATAFTDEQQENEGFFILLEYSGNQLSFVPDFTLNLNPIGNKAVTEGQTLSFTARVSDSTLQDLEFRLDRNPPPGATIDSDSGLFSWTPTSAQGPGSYSFDVVVMKGPIEDRETITVTVNQPTQTQPPPQPEPEPEPEENIPDFIDPKKGAQHYLDRYYNEASYKQWFDSNYPGYTIEEAIEIAIPGTFTEPEPEPEPEENIPDFIDPKKGAQHYLDRYYNEASYKQWFDSNYPGYTIEEAIEIAIPGSIEKPKEKKPILPFVDPDEDPQYYIDRYNNEPSYRAWFDENYPDYTIYEAVGVDENQEPKVGICAEGTKLVNGKCVPAKSAGGCLIATATFGSELAPQVQFLRELRDNTVLSTESGATFMAGFNSYYYSFSPTIADWERQSPVFKEAVKISITPLLSSLAILNYVDIDSEEEMLASGIGVILLNIGMYIFAPAFVAIKTKNLLGKRKNQKNSIGK